MRRVTMAVLLALAACGGADATAPAAETYAVELAGSAFEEIDGVLYIDGTLRVRDAGGTRIEGALVRLEATAGSTAAGATSGAGGLLGFTWAVPGGALPAVLRACASNSTAACTDWRDVLTLSAS